MALKPVLTLLACLALPAGCGMIEKLTPRAGATLAPVAQVARADIEKAGQPVMRLKVPSRGIDTLLTVRDRRGDVVNWVAADGMLFTFRGDVLIETRGLGGDLMSSAAPVAGRIASGEGHRRAYFFVGDDDQTGRRDYQCQVASEGNETVTIYGHAHNTRLLAETCERAVGRITNRYWFEGGKIRKSREWVSPAIGMIEFERVTG